MRKQDILFLLLLGISFIACEDDRVFKSYEYEPLLAVEGWIENGEYAKVLLTWTASFEQELDTASLMEYMERSAKVTVSDGSVTEVLGLQRNKDHIPPYVYYGNKLKGEPGKTYTLSVEVRNRSLYAETSIPDPIPLEGVRFVKTAPEDTTGYIYITFRNNAPEGIYYQVATKTDSLESVFTPCLYGNINAAVFEKGEPVDIQINKGPVLYPEKSFKTDFNVKNEIHLQFKTMHKPGYDFWRSWENEVVNTQNPIFPANSSLKSNIEGGVGIWCGYGVYTYTVTP